MANPFSSDFSADFGAGGATLAITQASQTVSAAASSAIIAHGTFAQTPQSLSAAGTVPNIISGSLSRSQASQGLVAAGTVPLGPDQGHLVTTQASQTLVGSATADASFHVANLAITQASHVLTNPGLPVTPPPTPPTVIAVGSQQDFVRRIRAVLPTGWFPDSGTPVLDGVLAGVANIWSSLWELLVYVARQKRIATATDINLDIIATDFLGQTLPRKPDELDAVYRARIRATIFQEMGTRKAVSDALTRLNGAPPKIFEPSNATDTGGYGAAGSRINTGLYYNSAGGYGSYKLPFQALIQTTLPQSVVTTSGVQGYGRKTGNPTVIGGYGVGAIEYASGVGELLSASDQEVYDAINAVKPVASIMWVSTQGTTVQPTGPQSGALLDVNFILDVSRLA